MSSPIVIETPPPPQKRWSTWAGTAVVTLGSAMLYSPEIEHAVVEIAKSAAGENALALSVVIFGTKQFFLANRRWFQRKFGIADAK